MTHVIAEMACSHDGSIELAKAIVDGAGHANANSIQFQIWHADDVVVPHHPVMTTLREIELSTDAWRDLATYSRDRFPEMEIISCVYDTHATDLAVSLGVDALKLHAADLANPKLLKHVAATGKRIDLSVGAASLEEIESALDVLRGSGDNDIWLMYGLQLFPTPPGAIDLRFMVMLKERFGLPVGYQDHADADGEEAFWLPAAAVGIGVDVLEKHITHDRSKKGIDHQAALNPDEFQKFVKMVREIESAMGSGAPRPFSEEELEYRRYARKSLVAAHDIAEGAMLEEQDLVAMRAPEIGIPPADIDRLLGRTVAKKLAAFSLVSDDDFR